MTSSKREARRIVVLASSLTCMFALTAANGCRRSAREPEAPLSLKLTSASFADGIIAKRCTCDGPQTSPELSWNSPPEDTRSFALIVTDKDSPFGYSFVHWVLYNLPLDKRELPEGIAKQDPLPNGSRQGRNDFGDIGYAGPCPPGHSPHRYLFVLYAVDKELDLPAGPSKKQVLEAMYGHVLARGELIGRYHR